MFSRVPSYEAALDEAVANYAGRMVGDGSVLDNFIERHRGDRTLLEKARDAIRNMVRKLTGAERKLAQTAEGKRTAALEAAAKQAKTLEGQKNTAQEGGGVRLSIKYDQSNIPYVVIERDILAGVPEEEWVKTVKDNLRKKYPDGVRIGNSAIAINKDSRREMTYSNYMQKLFKTEPDLYAEKLRATDKVDEILRATRNWANEALLHPRKDDIVDFARGTVLLRIGVNDYSAKVIVGNRGKNGLLLYDIISLKNAKIQERKKIADTAFTANAQNEPRSRQAVSTANNIPRDGEKSKGKFSIKGFTGTPGSETTATRHSLKEQDGRSMPVVANMPYGTLTQKRDAPKLLEQAKTGDTAAARKLLTMTLKGDFFAQTAKFFKGAELVPIQYQEGGNAIPGVLASMTAERTHNKIFDGVFQTERSGMKERWRRVK